MYMKATLTDLARKTRAIVSPVIRRGEEVVLTEFGKPVAKIIPYLPVRIFDDADEMRLGTLSDESILDAVGSARAETLEQAARHI
jgi:antitoxin (DNA-binding transcriptional repressor) of toxin-antitoxin stability system